MGSRAVAEVALPGKIGDFLDIGVAAAARGDIEATNAILDQRPEWITRVGAHSRTMLWEASRRGKFEMVQYLAERGADIDAASVDDLQRALPGCEVRTEPG